MSDTTPNPFTPAPIPTSFPALKRTWESGAWQSSSMPTLRVGDRVAKKRGYSFIGTVQSAFTKRNGETRIVVEMDCTGMLHIYSPQDVEPTTAELEISIKHNP